MKISNVKVRLTEKDILSIIEDYLKIENLKISNIKIGELIEVYGFYKSIVKINFKVKLGLGRIDKNKLKLKIIDIKLGKLKIWTTIANLGLKNILKDYKFMGIIIDKGVIYIDFTILCKYIPFVEFVLEYIMLLNGGIEVKVQDLNYNEEKNVLSFEELKDKIGENILREECIDKEGEVHNKKSNCYDKVRGEFKNKISYKYKNISDVLMFIPDIISLLYKLLKDKRIDIKTKILINGAIGYLIFPIDLIPDNIPVVGNIDDLGIGFILLDKIIDNIDDEIILEHWSGNENIILKIRDIKNNLFSTFGRDNTIKIFIGSLIGFKQSLKKLKKIIKNKR